MLHSPNYYAKMITLKAPLLKKEQKKNVAELILPINLRLAYVLILGAAMYVHGRYALIFGSIP